MTTFIAGLAAATLFWWGLAAIAGHHKKGWLHTGRVALGEVACNTAGWLFMTAVCAVMAVPTGVDLARHHLTRLRHRLANRGTPKPAVVAEHVGATEEYGDLLHEMAELLDQPLVVPTEPTDKYAPLKELAPELGFEIVRTQPRAPRPWNRPAGLHRKPEPLALSWLPPTQEWRIVELAERQTAGVGA